jgi:hypothetical protein
MSSTVTTWQPYEKLIRNIKNKVGNRKNTTSGLAGCTKGVISILLRLYFCTVYYTTENPTENENEVLQLSRSTVSSRRGTYWALNVKKRTSWPPSGCACAGCDSWEGARPRTQTRTGRIWSSGLKHQPKISTLKVSKNYEFNKLRLLNKFQTFWMLKFGRHVWTGEKYLSPLPIWGLKLRQKYLFNCPRANSGCTRSYYQKFGLKKNPDLSTVLITERNLGVSGVHTDPRIHASDYCIRSRILRILHWPSRRQQKLILFKKFYCLLLFEGIGTFKSFFKD